MYRKFTEKGERYTCKTTGMNHKSKAIEVAGNLVLRIQT